MGDYLFGVKYAAQELFILNELGFFNKKEDDDDDEEEEDSSDDEFNM